MSEPTNNTPVATESANVSSQVLKSIQKLQSAGTLKLPANYSAENALRAAWFHIQNSDQRDKILSCTMESQANALYDMIIQGCDVSKKQGYFIPYGSKLIFQRSYFGDQVVAERVMPGIKIYADVIYAGETVKVKKESTSHGMITRVHHDDLLFPREGAKIVGAYCGVVDENGEYMGDELMEFSQIQLSWKKSKTYGANSSTFHNEQPDQACLRTVIRRRLKSIINSSNDEALLESLRRSEMDSVEAEMAGEIAECGNGEVITVQAEPEALPTATIAAQLSEEPKGEAVAAAPVDDGGAPY